MNTSTVSTLLPCVSALGRSARSRAASGSAEQDCGERADCGSERRGSAREAECARPARGRRAAGTRGSGALGKADSFPCFGRSK
eukprot:gene9409-biopygen5486